MYIKMAGHFPSVREPAAEVEVPAVLAVLSVEEPVPVSVEEPVAEVVQW